MRSRAVTLASAALARTEPREAPETIDVPLLTGGIRADKPAVELALNEAVEIDGLHMVAGRLVVDTGYVNFGDELIGLPQREFQAIFDNSTSATILVTTDTVYNYNTTHQQWQYVSWNQMHQVTAGYAAGATVLALDNVTDLAIGTLVGIMLTSGRQHKTIITNIAVLDITIQDAIPVGETVTINAQVMGAPVLNGDPAAAQVCIDTFAPLNYIIFCNGVDEVMRYFDGVVDILPGFPSATVCKALAVFHECLLVANLIEGGTEMPGRVRMSDQADPEGWVPGVNGIAAVYDLIDTDDAILALKGLGPWMIAYREASIMRASYIGAFNETLFWEYMIRADSGNEGDGIQSQGAVVAVGAAHVLVGHINIWRYTGNYELEPLGEAVFNEFLAVGGDFDATKRVMLFCAYVPPLREVWVFYPALGLEKTSDAPNKMLRLSIATGTWTTRVFAHRMYSAGTYVPVTEDITWATAPGLWNDPFWARTWATRVFSQNVPNIILSSADVARTFAYDYVNSTDAGNVISWKILTGVYGDESSYYRWQELTILAQGNNVDVAGATEDSSRFRDIAELDFGRQRISVKHLWIDRVSLAIQLRFMGDDPTFELRRFKIERELDTEW